MDELLNQLENLLTSLLQEHERLLELIKQGQRALAEADPQRVADLCRQQNVHVQQIGQLEKERQQLVGQVTQLTAPTAAEPLTLRRIAAQAAPEQRGRLVELHEQLRRTIETVRHENGVARRATEGLLNHVQGLMQAVVQAVAGAGLYSRGGAVAGSPVVVSSFAATG